MFSLSVAFDAYRTHTLHPALDSEAVMTTQVGRVVEEGTAAHDVEDEGGGASCCRH